MRTRIEVGGHPDRPTCLLSTGALAPRRLRVGGDHGPELRIGLVAAQALLLGGDEVRVSVSVEGPHRVHVCEIGGTVAYDMRGRRARWDVDLTLRGGAQVIWHSEPLVLASGADVDRSTSARLEADCTLALREVMVLGRSDEVGGAVRTRTRLVQGGEPVVAEDLDLSPRRWAVLGGHRCLDTMTTVGYRLPDGVDVLQAEAEASIVRWSGEDLHGSPLPARWRDAVRMSPHPSASPARRGGQPRGRDNRLDPDARQGLRTGTEARRRGSRSPR